MNQPIISYDKHFIDGSWSSGSPKTDPIEVDNSTTEELLGRVPTGGKAEIDIAVAAAKKAWPSWSALGVEGRAPVLEALTDALMSRVDQLSKTFSQEVGIVSAAGTAFQTMAANQFRDNVGIARKFQWEHQIGATRVVREPIGVVGAITPWNYPLPMIVAKVAPALAAGCTVVVKPAEVAPLTAFILAEAAQEVGLPPGVLNVVSGRGKDAGEALVAHPDVDMISFTGSTHAGRRISAVGGQTVKRLSLELGGKSACVVLPDADVSAAVNAAMGALLLNNGQACSALTRIVVPRTLLSEVEDAAAAYIDALVVGDPLEPGTTVGPMASKVHQERVAEFIERGTSTGVRTVRGGTGMPGNVDRGYFIRPTVFTVEDPKNFLAQEEIFGPVQTILAYDTIDEAVAIANDSIYGLAGAVFGADVDRATSVAREIRSGQVDVNCVNFSPDVPFGGYKQSGNGRTWGEYGFEEFLEIKSLTIA